MSDVAPSALFDVLSDLEGQVKWDQSMSEAKVVKPYEKDGVLAVELSFPSGFWLVPPRQAGYFGLERMVFEIKDFKRSMPKVFELF